MLLTDKHLIKFFVIILSSALSLSLYAENISPLQLKVIQTRKFSKPPNEVIKAIGTSCEDFGGSFHNMTVYGKGADEIFLSKKNNISDNGVRGASIGVAVQNIPDLPGALVAYVEDGSPAQQEGIFKGDLIIKFDNKLIESTEDLANAVKQSKSGKKISIDLLRKGSIKTFNLTLADKKSDNSTQATSSNFIDIGNAQCLLGNKFPQQEFSLIDMIPIVGGIARTAISINSLNDYMKSIFQIKYQFEVNSNTKETILRMRLMTMEQEQVTDAKVYSEYFKKIGDSLYINAIEIDPPTQE